MRALRNHFIKCSILGDQALPRFSNISSPALIQSTQGAPAAGNGTNAPASKPAAKIDTSNVDLTKPPPSLEKKDVKNMSKDDLQSLIAARIAARGAERFAGAFAGGHRSSLRMGTSSKGNRAPARVWQ